MADIKNNLVTSFAYLKNNRRLLFITLIITFLAGTVLQLDWIKDHCKQFKLFGNTQGACKHNELRVFFGWLPFAFGQFLLLLSTLLIFNKQLNGNQNQRERFIQNFWLCQSAFILFLIAPLWDYRNRSYLIGLFVFLVAFCILNRNLILDFFKDLTKLPKERVEIEFEQDLIKITIWGDLCKLTTKTIYEEIIESRFWEEGLKLELNFEPGVKKNNFHSAIHRIIKDVCFVYSIDIKD